MWPLRASNPWENKHFNSSGHFCFWLPQCPGINCNFVVVLNCLSNVLIISDTKMSHVWREVIIALETSPNIRNERLFQKESIFFWASGGKVFSLLRPCKIIRNASVSTSSVPRFCRLLRVTEALLDRFLLRNGKAAVL